MALEAAGLLIAAISALSSMIIAGINARREHREVKKEKLRKLEKRAKTPLKIGGKQLEKVIDDETLKTLTSRIQNSVSELNEVLGDKNAGDNEQKIALAKAKSQICQALQQIRMLNENDLPTKTLWNYWNSHQCE